MTEQEAWCLVSKAIKNSTYNATEEYEELPHILQRIDRKTRTIKRMVTNGS